MAVVLPGVTGAEARYDFARVDAALEGALFHVTPDSNAPGRIYADPNLLLIQVGVLAFD